MSFTQTVKKSICLFLMLLSFQVCLSAAKQSTWPYENETPEQKDARMAWWHEARFGMFIHWGVYAVPAGTHKGQKINRIGEWIMNRGKIPVADYKEYAKQFNPVKYNPDEWVRLAKEAGMKYIIITSKHHDGFALFDSKVTDWDVVDATPYGKDLLKPLAEACRKHGVKLGFYYSQAQDWCHPGGAAAFRPTKQGWDNPDAERIDKYAKAHGGHWDPAQLGDMNEYIRTIAAPQVKEILTNYGDIAVLWWDTPTNMNRERADLLQPLVALQPGIITNNRLGGGYPGDTDTPEQHIPATGLGDRAWEACMTMNDTWGFKSYDDNWKPTETLIRNLIDIASKGGNYLLNVGPTAEGLIPQPSIDRLKAVGAWMRVNGESIYGTAASPFAKLTWGRCTKKVVDGRTTLYLHIFDWPEDGELLVPGLESPVAKASLVANGQTLETTRTEDGVVVSLPKEAIDPIATVCALHLDGELSVKKAIPTQGKNGQILLPVKLADIHNPSYGSHIELEEKDGKSNIGHWTDARAWVEWSFRVRKAGSFDVVADVALQAAQTKIELTVGGSKLPVTVDATGGYDQFRKVTLGRIEISEAGVHTLKITPVKKNWNPLNIRSVVLVPKK